MSKNRGNKNQISRPITCHEFEPGMPAGSACANLNLHFALKGFRNEIALVPNLFPLMHARRSAATKPEIAIPEANIHPPVLLTNVPGK